MKFVYCLILILIGSFFSSVRLSFANAATELDKTQPHNIPRMESFGYMFTYSVLTLISFVLTYVPIIYMVYLCIVSLRN